MSGLHRDINAPHNFLPSRRLQKPRGESRGAATEKRDEPIQNEKGVSVHQQPPPRGKKAALVQNHPVDNQRRHDARHNINEYHRRRHGDAEDRCNTLGVKHAFSPITTCISILIKYSIMSMSFIPKHDFMCFISCVLIMLQI